jgi:hypothetical protein
MPKLRPLLRPRPHPDQQFRAITVAVDGWLRLHWPGNATAFSRNPEHRFSPENGPFEVLYLGQDEKTATLEVMGDRLYGASDRKTVDIPKAEWFGRWFSDIVLQRPVKVADLFSPAGLEAARIDLAVLAHNDLLVPQAWAESVMTHSAMFCGLLYGSRFTKKKCLALFAVPGEVSAGVSGSPRLFSLSSAAGHLLESYDIRIT